MNSQKERGDFSPLSSDTKFTKPPTTPVLPGPVSHDQTFLVNPWFALRCPVKHRYFTGPRDANPDLPLGFVVLPGPFRALSKFSKRLSAAQLVKLSPTALPHMSAFGALRRFVCNAPGHGRSTGPAEFLGVEISEMWKLRSPSGKFEAVTTAAAGGQLCSLL